MGVQYTKDQMKVIGLHKKNLLVSAAAGSGKTAVLVERIIQMVSNKEHPVDIDRLLIVTYTNAAAAEMRERISDAIALKLETDPENTHLQRQSALIHNAQITTIDSFCLYLLRNHMDALEIDPAFRPADEGEIKMLKQDVLNDLLEEKFVEAKESFLRLVECFAGGSGEKMIEEMILQLHTFACSYPFPEKWLDTCLKQYQFETVEELMNTDWMKQMIRSAKERLFFDAETCEAAIALCHEADGPYMYGELLENEQKMLLNAASKDTYEDIMVALEAVDFKRLPSKKDDTVDPEKRERAKEMRAAVKKDKDDLKDTYFAKQPEHIVKDAASIAPLVEEIVTLTKEFMERFQKQKQEKNVIDFSDMEHMALKILVTPSEEKGFEPTLVAMEYRDYFEEIMVDEYQDANLVQEYLLASISRNALGDHNRFMVGDVKQSIYRFRMSMPELFMEKMAYYTDDSVEDSDEVLISLCQNFRSRKEVLDSCNAVFEKIMCKELGGVVYDGPARLYLGADYPENDEDHTTELLVVTGKADEESEEKPEKYEKKEMEAHMVARRILELVGHFQVLDKETKAYRPARFSDIVILFRSTSGWDDTFRQVLTEYGIPVYVNSKTGYFSALEVSTILSLLRVLDNPRQDIPLFAVLHSPLFDFTDEELALIKATYEGDSLVFFDYLKEEMPELPEPLRKKKEIFFAFLTEYRRKAGYVSVHVLIEEILRKTGYMDYVTSLPAGAQRKANLEMLLQKATEFEKTSYQGLFRFVRFIEQLQEYEIDYGEALSFDEGSDAVRIMSIHKSKGLEFPICFVSGLSKKHNKTDLTRQILMDMNMGIGMDYWDEERRIKDKDLRKKVMADHMEADALGEELRVLYVALTRAKEKLILTAALEDASKEKEKQKQHRLTKDGHFSKLSLLSGNSYLDWLLMVYGKNETVFSYRSVFYKDLVKDEFEETVKDAILYEKLVNRKPLDGIDEKLVERVSQTFAFTYPHKNLEKLFTKTTVSELKKAAAHEIEEDGSAPLFAPTTPSKIIPKFISDEEEITGTQRGSAYHRVMELLDFSKEYSKEAYEEALAHFVTTKKITKEAKDAVEYRQIQKCLASDVGIRMQIATKKDLIYKEQPFVYGLSAKRLNEEFPEEETVLIQGIIDVFWEEEDGLVILDYKTDALSKEEDFVKRYKVQLDYYKEALENITGKVVKEIIIYSFKLGIAFAV